MRRKVRNRNKPEPDPIFNSEVFSKLVNYIMRKGKKTIAERIAYNSFDIIKEKTKNENPLEVFETAVRNVGPLMEVKSRRVGGANYQVPIEVKQDRRLSLALRWIISASRGKKGSTMESRLADEIIAASKNEGDAVKKRENTHKMAEANKAFAHFSW